MSGPNLTTAGSTSADMMAGASPRHLVGFTNGGFSVLATTNETMPQETNADRYGTHWVGWRVAR